MPTPEQQLAGFIAKFTPEMGRRIRAARRKLRALLPGATELVFDNYNFLVIGYGGGERTSDSIISIAAYAKGLNLFFLHGKELPDPQRLLRGGGKQVRSVRLEAAADLDRPAVRALVKAAAKGMPRGRHRLVVKLIAAKQRPRR